MEWPQQEGADTPQPKEPLLRGEMQFHLETSVLEKGHSSACSSRNLVKDKERSA